MTKLVLLAATILSVSVGGAFAQNRSADTQTPAAPQAGSQGPESANSLPRGAATIHMDHAGNDVNTTVVR